MSIQSGLGTGTGRTGVRFSTFFSRPSTLLCGRIKVCIWLLNDYYGIPSVVLKARKNLTTHTQKNIRNKVEAQAKKVHVWRKTQKSTRTQLLVVLNIEDGILFHASNGFGGVLQDATVETDTFASWYGLCWRPKEAVEADLWDLEGPLVTFTARSSSCLLLDFIIDISASIETARPLSHKRLAYIRDSTC